jgi:hypothetical protein
MSLPAYQRAERSLLGTQFRRWYAARTAQRAVGELRPMMDFGFEVDDTPHPKKATEASAKKAA